MAVHESKQSCELKYVTSFMFWTTLYNESANEIVHYKTKDDEDQPPDSLTF